MYEYTDQFGEKWELTFYRSKYVDNGRPYVGAWCTDEDGYWGPDADVTVTVWAPLTEIDGYHVHADTNNAPHLVEWMCEQGLMTRTGQVGRSGWCEYPEVELSHEWYDSLPAYE